VPAQSETLRSGVIALTYGKSQRRKSQTCARSAPAAGIAPPPLRPALRRAEQRSASCRCGITPPWRGKLAATGVFCSAGVPPAGAWASCPRAGRERDAPETAGKMPPLHTELALHIAIVSRLSFLRRGRIKWKGFKKWSRVSRSLSFDKTLLR